MSYPPGKHDCWFDTGAMRNACPPTTQELLMPWIALILFLILAFILLYLLVKYCRIVKGKQVSLKAVDGFIIEGEIK